MGHDPEIYATELSLRFYRTLLSGRLPFEVKGHLASTSHAKCIYSEGLVTSPMWFYLAFIEQTSSIYTLYICMYKLHVNFWSIFIKNSTRWCPILRYFLILNRWYTKFLNKDLYKCLTYNFFFVAVKFHWDQNQSCTIFNSRSSIGVQVSEFNSVLIKMLFQ